MGFVLPASIPLTNAEFYRGCKKQQAKLAHKACNRCRDRFMCWTMK